MSNRLPTLAAEIRDAHAGVKAAAQIAAQRAIEAGHALIEAKSLLKHGEWLPWLKEHCHLSERTAQLYMHIVRLGLKSETVADLGVKAAAKVLMTITTPNYDPFAQCDEEGKRLWGLFVVFLARTWRSSIDNAFAHVEWIVQRQFRTPSEWLGEPGTSFRRTWGMREASDDFKTGWLAFVDDHADKSLAHVGDMMAVHAESGAQ